MNFVFVKRSVMLFTLSFVVAASMMTPTHAITFTGFVLPGVEHLIKKCTESNVYKNLLSMQDTISNHAVIAKLKQAYTNYMPSIIQNNPKTTICIVLGYLFFVRCCRNIQNLGIKKIFSPTIKNNPDNEKKDNNENVKEISIEEFNNDLYVTTKNSSLLNNTKNTIEEKKKQTKGPNYQDFEKIFAEIQEKEQKEQLENQRKEQEKKERLESNKKTLENLLPKNSERYKSIPQNELNRIFFDLTLQEKRTALSNTYQKTKETIKEKKIKLVYFQTHQDAQIQLNITYDTFKTYCKNENNITENTISNYLDKLEKVKAFNDLSDNHINKNKK